MECLQQVVFNKAEASGSGGCVEVGFHKATTSDSGGCVEVGGLVASNDGCGQVHVRNSRFPERVVDIPVARWEQLVESTLTGRQVNLSEWFPSEEYGDFAATFNERERSAFEDGILKREANLIGH